MIPARRSLPLAALVACLAVPAVHEPVHGKTIPTVKDRISLKSAGSPALSPDGASVVYHLQEADWAKNSYFSQLWIVSARGGTPRQLTSGDASAWSPAWSPDGGRVAFLRSSSGGPQVHLVAPGGGAAIQLTRASNGVEGFQWSPDGRRIAYTSSEAVERRALTPEPPEFHIVGNDPSYGASLWVIPVPSTGDTARATAVRVTEGKAFSADDAFAWSPDSRRIAFAANQPDEPRPFWTYDLYVVDVASRAVKKLVADRGPQFFPLWSPDGRRIAFKTFVKGQRDQYHVYSIGYVATVPAEGGAVEVLTADFDENLTPLAWGPDGIYFYARQRTYSHLFRVDPGTRRIARVTEPATSLKTTFTFSRDFRRVAFLGQDDASFQEVYCAPIAETAHPTRLTELGKQLDDWVLGTRELLQWTSEDGTPIEGVLIKPAGFDPRRKHPLVVIPHTGPLEADQLTVTRDVPYPADAFAARGALVLRPNYRGSVGYGARFRSILRRNQGVPQYEDVLGGVDLLIERGWVDSTRVGLMGWSAGAYIAAISAVYDHRFRAVSMLETASDWRLFYTLGAGTGVSPDYFSGALPWDDPDYYRSVSALTYVSRARTPTLIQHGDQDRTAPIAGAHELYRGLKDAGAPVKMVIYPGMGHVPGTLRQLELVTQQNLDWFDYWLWGRGKP
jgi:dipeptidyl aminopeptidase/acylaminoacyl peptidase